MLFYVIDLDEFSHECAARIKINKKTGLTNSNSNSFENSKKIIYRIHIMPFDD